MLEIKHLTRGIKSNRTLYQNEDLVNFFQSRGWVIPQDYVLATVNIEKLNKDFLKNTKSKYIYPDHDALDRAVSALHKIMYYKLSSHSKVNNIWYAIQNCERSTSPGYPWNVKYKTKGDVLEHEQKLVLNYVSLIGKGKNIVSLSVASPKEEILSYEKNIIKGKQRTFQCCDIIMYLVGLMLYSGQNDAMNNMAFSEDWLCTGYTQFYGGFDRMARILLKHLAKPEDYKKLEFLGYDISAMEASISPLLFVIIYRLRWECIKPNIHKDELKYYENLHNWYSSNVTYKFMIDPNGMLGILIGVNPSGQLNTLTDNCLAILVSFLYALARQIDNVSDIVSEYRNIPCKIMGDDSKIGSNQYSIKFAEYVTELGFLTTLEGQGQFHEVPFLSTDPYYLEDMMMWVAKPNYNKLVASLLFYFKKRSWRLCYAKANAILVLVWPFAEWRHQIQECLKYIEIKHDEDMRNEHRFDDLITYDQITTLRLRDSEIDYLVYGREALDVTSAELKQIKEKYEKSARLSHFLYNEDGIKVIN